MCFYISYKVQTSTAPYHLAAINQRIYIPDLLTDLTQLIRLFFYLFAASSRSSAPIMVTGTFAFLRGHPNASWSTNFQNPFGNGLNAPTQRQASSGYDNSYGPSAQPGQISLTVTGYLYSTGKARDQYSGQYLEHLLQAKNINIANAPPFEQVTAQTSYANHGVVKINNVRDTRSFWQKAHT